MKLQFLIAFIVICSSFYLRDALSKELNESALGRPGHVGSGDDVLSVEVAVGDQDDGITRMLIKARGPSLTSLGIAGALQDPTLEIRDSNGTLASNDNWKDALGAEIEATGLAPVDDRESAVLITLGAGTYTAIVRGNGGTQGMAMVEAYIVKKY